MRPILATALLAIASVFSSLAFAAGEVSGMVVINTKVGLAEDNFIMDTIARVGMPDYSDPSQGYALTGSSSPVPVPPNASSTQFMTYSKSSPKTSEEILNWGNLLWDQAGSIGNGIRDYAVQNGLMGGIYTYEQKVDVKDRSDPMVLYWQVIAFTDGRIINSEPQLIPPEPTLIHFNYISKKSDPDFPSTMTYPNAGKLTWRLVNFDMQPLTADHVVNTNGEFDEPMHTGTGPTPIGCVMDAGEVSCNENFGVECLIDVTKAGCSRPAGFKSIKELMSQYAAQGGVIDYARSIAPYYDAVESPPGSEEYTMKARVAISINSRSITGFKEPIQIQACGGSGTANYVETGTIGYALKNMTDRFMVSENGNYSIIDQIITISMSPNNSFSKSVNLPNTHQCSNYAPDMIIDPLFTNSVYNWRNDTVNGIPSSQYVSVANLICQ